MVWNFSKFPFLIPTGLDAHVGIGRKALQRFPFLGKKNPNGFLIAAEGRISFSVVPGRAVLVRRTNTDADFCQFFISKWRPTACLPCKATARVKREAEWSIFHCRLHTGFFVLASKPIIFSRQQMLDVTDFHVFPLHKLCLKAASSFNLFNPSPHFFFRC